MKQVVILLLLFFPHLMDVYGAHRDVNNNKIGYLPVQHNKKAHQSIKTSLTGNYTIKQNVGLIIENEYLASAEDDDENENTVRKHISQVRHFPAFPSALITDYCNSSLLTRLPSGRQIISIPARMYLIHRAIII